jgi:hypothetical protein
MTVTKVHDAAARFLRWGVDSDKEGEWLFMGGDELAWCAGFVLACCFGSGNWLASSIREHAKFRSVSALVREAEARGDWFPVGGPMPGDDVETAGVLAVVKGQQHIGVVAIDDLTPHGKIGVIHGNSSNNAVERGNWTLRQVEGFITVPLGGWQ